MMSPRFFPAVCVLALCLISFTTSASAVDNVMGSVIREEEGNTYYVAPDGKNSNPGTSQAPWATPGYGSKQLQPGDTLIIRGGRYVMSKYWTDMITPSSGSPGAWITIRGEKGCRPVLAGRNNLYSAAVLDGVSHVRIKNLEITSDEGAFFREGISITDDPVRHIILRNLFIHHIDEMGIDLKDVYDVRILNCKITYCGFGAIGGPGGDEGGVRQLLVKGCTLSHGGHYYQGGDGSTRPYDRPDGIGLEPSDGPVVIKNTIASHNWGDGLDSKCANTRIRDCIVANNYGDGIKLWQGNSTVVNTLVYGTGDGSSQSPWCGIVIEGSEDDRFTLMNCAIDDNPSRHAYSMTVQYDDRKTPVSVLMRNCIVANSYGAAFFGPSVKLKADHTIFYRGTSEPEQVIARGRNFTETEINNGQLGIGNICNDPLFIHPAWGEIGDYHLRPGSAAIDSGTEIGAPKRDLDGERRTVGDGYDIGPYEYVP